MRDRRPLVPLRLMLGPVLGLALALLAGAPARAERAAAGGLIGRVSDGASPLATAIVFAYELADQTVRQATTDGQGNFLFDRLPAGIFKVIAFKQGFLPAVVLLSRASAEAHQFLQVQLTAEAQATEDGADFWSIRQQIPRDVLRRIELAIADTVPGPARATSSPVARFEATMRAVTGVREDTSAGPSQLTGGQVDLRGTAGQIELGLSGRFAQLAPEAFEGTATSMGEARAVDFSLERGEGTQLSLSSVNNQMFTPRPARSESMDMEMYRLSLSHAFGASGRSGFAARYFEENNYFLSGPIRAIGVPRASRLWHVEGTYEASVSDRATVNAGLRYRAREFDATAGGMELPEQRVDIFGSAGMQVRPALLVEYGLYSTLLDGSLSFAPRGELVFQLAPQWELATAGSYRLEGDDEGDLDDFFVMFFPELGTCEQIEDYCYEMTLKHSFGEGEQLSVGASQRRFGETLRLQFSEDFFDAQDSLYLVPGDSLPQVEVGYAHRWSPYVLSRLESSLASGGGGLVQRGRRGYENAVSYLVTSVDTRFEGTSTGVFVAFHRLEQRLEPLSGPRRSNPEMERERLQLLLTQDLDALSRVAANLAVQLNMELSRGADDQLSLDADEIRRRFTGAIAVTF